MRVFAVLNVTAVLALTISAASATDFDALLSELTFDNTSVTGDNVTLDVAAEKAAEALEPVPSETVTKLVMPTESLAEVEAPADLPEPGTGSAPLAEVQPAPQPMQAPTAEPPANVDLNQAFAAQECNSCGTCDRACDGCGCQSGCGGHRRELHNPLCTTCVPYHPPRLPSSTFHQYFRSDACNVDVWNGYQNRCCFAAKHTRGECDCFEKDRHCKGYGPVVYDAPCASPVCAAPARLHVKKLHAKRIFDIAKRADCDKCDEGCDSGEACCDGLSGCDQ